MLQTGIKAVLTKLKLEPPPNTTVQMPNSFHSTSTQGNGWAIPHIIKEAET